MPYRVGGNGEQILVPADRAAELRLKMAVQGLPLGGGVGFEVFDKTAFGVSDFTQRLNYQRALQGELTRTILSFPRFGTRESTWRCRSRACSATTPPGPRQPSPCT